MENKEEEKQKYTYPAIVEVQYYDDNDPDIHTNQFAADYNWIIDTMNDCLREINTDSPEYAHRLQAYNDFNAQLGMAMVKKLTALLTQREDSSFRAYGEKEKAYKQEIADLKEKIQHDEDDYNDLLAKYDALEQENKTIQSSSFDQIKEDDLRTYTSLVGRIKDFPIQVAISADKTRKVFIIKVEDYRSDATVFADAGEDLLSLISLADRKICEVYIQIPTPSKKK